MAEVNVSNTKEITERFGDQGGFFDVVIKPMLQGGHEGELLSWLKETLLIRSSCNCTTPRCQGKIMLWGCARLRDRYKWICPDCNKKQTIREDSFFNGIQGDFKTCLMLILAWCQDTPLEIAAQMFEIKEHVVKKVFERCGKVCKSYIENHPDEFQIGGPGIILIIDEFPGGYMMSEGADIVTSKRRNNNFNTILCIAETNCLPPKMWLHMIQATPQSYLKTDQQGNQKCGIVEEGINVITKRVRPGSFIVANSKARSCRYETLQELKQYRVFNAEYLQKFDTPAGSKLVENLTTIWQNGVDICEEIQESTRSMGQSIIATHLWKQRFGYASSSSTAFQYMLNHIVEIYRFT